MPIQQHHAVVIGGSVAGLAATAALARRFEQVTLVERHDPATARLHDGSLAPQGGFPHVLLAGGAAALERLAPGLTEDLFAHGAVNPRDMDLRSHWWAAGVVRHDVPDLGVDVPMASRGLVEQRLRAAVVALPNVSTRYGAVVRGLRLTAGRVTGVDVQVDGEASTIEADLVVDASGRGSSASKWLMETGIGQPPVTEVGIDIRYTAVDVERRPSDVDGSAFAVVQNDHHLARIGVALPAEGDRWKIVLGGYFGDGAEASRDGMLAFARSLPDSAIAVLLENPWMSEPARYRFPSSRHTHWEKLGGLPEGFVAVGDSVASFNPIYGQGMSSAALQAEALSRCLERPGHHFARTAAKALAAVVSQPWQVAAGADFIYPQTTGHRGPGSDRINAYLGRITVAAAFDEEIHIALSRVLQLLAPPQSLMRPALMLRVRKVMRSVAYADAGSKPVPPVAA